MSVLTFLVVAAVVLGAVSGCGLPADLPPAGSVDVDPIVSGPLVIDSIAFSVSGNGITPINGTIDVRDSNATGSSRVGGLPSGFGYQLALTATTADQGTFCSGQATFDVAAPETTELSMSFVCINANTVRVISNGGTPHTCPSVASLSVARAPGGVLVSASAFSFDNLTPLFTWDAPLGSFGAPDSD